MCKTCSLYNSLTWYIYTYSARQEQTCGKGEAKIKKKNSSKTDDIDELIINWKKCSKEKNKYFLECCTAV